MEIIDLFDNLDEDSQILCLLQLSDLIIDNIQESRGVELAQKALEDCWRWLDGKDIGGDDLYNQLENLDEHDIMTFMSFEKDEKRLAIWKCIANALAYTAQEAYYLDGEEYLPQTLDNVDLSTVEEFLSNFKVVYAKEGIIKEIISYLVELDVVEISKRIKAVKQRFPK